MESIKDKNSVSRVGNFALLTRAVQLSAFAATALITANAAAVTVGSYDLNQNGEGPLNSAIFPQNPAVVLKYTDGNYAGIGATGSPTTEGSPLAGGKGALTDGDTVTSGHWGNSWNSNAAGTGKFVGWQNFDPTIVFRFQTGYQSLTSVTLFYDDNDNAGLVNPPLSITVSGVDPINGAFTSSAQTITDGPGVVNGTVNTVFNLTSILPVGFITKDLTISITRRNVTPGQTGTYNSSWIMLSEVQFQGVEVPETGTWAALGLGAVALAQVARRARAARS